jgi:hypothetical protein
VQEVRKQSMQDGEILDGRSARREECKRRRKTVMLGTDGSGKAMDGIFPLLRPLGNCYGPPVPEQD